ncbi:type VI secretion system transmembrane protein TssO [Myroides sp. M-43]|uniref:type VI secretion system transmembrane protein TssO n=1 Tax=Myroides oncorhynchi TaxID=2893756 RepID=UPI001E64E211|nr:type VI secretion system transmembrane protein TssO [Myroides oncorhynchi]MCC9043541.1 type VI secretion system transmembrane protein TssO [Myroides oncorhynchi]
MTQSTYQSLSKTERRYQFFYLVAMLVVSLILLGIVFLRGFNSPFSNQTVLEIQMLEQKYKFIEQQNIVEPLLESTFNKVSILSFETPQPFVENDITNSINEVANSFANVPIYDPRKEAYIQIGYFYKMYFEDKKIIAKKSENIKLFRKQFEECSIGFKDKEQQLVQRRNALLAR